jgi:hypothetical protein
MAIVVVRGAASGFARVVEAGPHRLAADEPVAAGGIANRCPVHRTLTSEIDIRTRLV